MRPEYVRAALHLPGLKPQTSRLLAHMADVADDRGMFWQSRARCAHETGINPDTIKAALRELVGHGYIANVRDAEPGKSPRMVRLMPDRWPAPPPWRAQGDDLPDPDQPLADADLAPGLDWATQAREGIRKARGE